MSSAWSHYRRQMIYVIQSVTYRRSASVHPNMCVGLVYLYFQLPVVSSAHIFDKVIIKSLSNLYFSMCATLHFLGFFF